SLRRPHRPGEFLCPGEGDLGVGPELDEVLAQIPELRHRGRDHSQQSRRPHDGDEPSYQWEVVFHDGEEVPEYLDRGVEPTGPEKEVPNFDLEVAETVPEEFDLAGRGPVSPCRLLEQRIPVLPLLDRH